MTSRTSYYYNNGLTSDGGRPVILLLLLLLLCALRPAVQQLSLRADTGRSARTTELSLGAVVAIILRTPNKVH